MKRSVFALWAFMVFLCLPSGCSESSSLDPDKPVTLTFWHVFGAQADSPMNALVERFNRTLGREKGIVVSVTSISNSTDIHFALVAAARREPGAGSLPDMFVTYPKTVLAIGPERMMDWADLLPDEIIGEYVPSFVEEGKVNGRLVLLPVAKSTNALFLNATIFDGFSRDTGITYADLSTWEGMFRAAGRYYEWSGGKAFFKYDDWLYYSMLNTASLGGDIFKDGKINFRDEQFRKTWGMLAECAAAGGVCLLDGYSTTAMMTGEALCGVESTASLLYFRDKVIFPDNTTMPLRLKILPVPGFEGGKPLAVQRGGGLGVIKSTKRKEQAAAVFGRWLTETENNLPFATSTGYLPVKESACRALLGGEAGPFANETYKELYATVSDIYATHAFYVPSFFERYGEVEETFCETQREIFIKYRTLAQTGASISADLVREMLKEMEQGMEPALP